jgi:hypothetical protein
MITIENQDLVFAFTAIEDGVYQNRMYVKGEDKWFDMPNISEWGIESWNRTLWNCQLDANPILKEWGCERDDYRGMLSK